MIIVNKQTSQQYLNNLKISTKLPKATLKLTYHMFPLNEQNVQKHIGYSQLCFFRKHNPFHDFCIKQIMFQGLPGFQVFQM